MRRWLVYAGAALALLLIGYGLGRWAQPAKIKIETHETVRTETQIQYKDRIVVQTTVRYVKAKQQHQVIVYVTKPDGTKTETVTTDTSSSTKAAEAKTAEKDTSATEVAKSETRKETLKEVTYSKPQWRLGGFVGLQLHQNPAYGVNASRRLLGPLWLDASLDTGERANFGLSLEF